MPRHCLWCCCVSRHGLLLLSCHRLLLLDVATAGCYLSSPLPMPILSSLTSSLTVYSAQGDNQMRQTARNLKQPILPSPGRITGLPVASGVKSLFLLFTLPTSHFLVQLLTCLPLATGERIVSIQASGYHAIALTGSGRVITLGHVIDR